MIDNELRIKSLLSYDVLDTPPESEFDEIAEAASDICKTPVALVSFVADDRQWFKARVGFDACETPLAQSVCAHAVEAKATLIIPDLRADPRTKDNTLVTGEPGIRFYAGVPLVDGDGQALGTLCVIDTVPRPNGLTVTQTKLLHILARQVISNLECRRALERSRRDEARYRTLFEALNAAYCAIRVKFDESGSAVDYQFLDVNDKFERQTGLQAATGKWMRDLAPGHEQRWFDIYGEVAKTGQVVRFEEAAEALGRHYEVQAYRIGAAGENLVGILFQDISDQRAAERRAERARESLDLALAVGSGIGSWDWDIRANVVTADRRFAELYGVSPELAAAGAPIENFFGNVDAEDREALRTAIDVSMTTGAPFIAEYRITQADGSERWVEARGQVIYDLEGNPVRFPGASFDITERKQALNRQMALTELGDRLRELSDPREMYALAASLLGESLDIVRAGQGPVDREAQTIDFNVDWNSPGTPSIAGTYAFRDFETYIDDLLQGRVVVIRDVAGDARTRDSDAFPRLGVKSLINLPVMERGNLVSVVQVQDDRVRDWSYAELFFIRSVGDRTQDAINRLESEKQKTLLNQELSHRLKNTLAVVAAIAKQTLRHNEDQAAVASFSERLTALSSAHDVLLQESWAAARISTVIDGVLRLHARPGRIVSSGPDIRLGPKATLSLSMLLHELATNAVKYGALSNDRGTVEVSWKIQRGSEAQLNLLWRETGGPPPIAPERTGFGSRLIKSGLVGTRKADIRYEPIGLVAEFSAPMTAIAEN